MRFPGVPSNPAGPVHRLWQRPGWKPSSGVRKVFIPRRWCLRSTPLILPHPVQTPIYGQILGEVVLHKPSQLLNWQFEDPGLSRDIQEEGFYPLYNLPNFCWSLLRPRGVYNIVSIAIATYFCSLGFGVAEMEKYAVITSFQGFQTSYYGGEATGGSTEWVYSHWFCKSLQNVLFILRSGK